VGFKFKVIRKMINPKIKLHPEVYNLEKLEQVPTRNGYGDGLIEAGEKNENIVALCADLTDSTRTAPFRDKFPDRFIEMGVAEQNMVAVAAGLEHIGKIPFLSSYAVFSPGRNNEQIRTLVSYSGRNVKIIGAHAGISVGPDGATHQALEDIALMRVQPRMIVIVPCDSIETKKATIAAAEIRGPVYLRFTREKTPVFTTEETPFEIGKALVLRDPELAAGRKADATIIACGPLVHNAILAADQLSKEGIECIVVNNHTIKPIDKETIIEVAKKSGKVVTVEEHQVNGGLGSAVCEVLSENYPVPVARIGVQDRFGESGEPNELIEKFGMGVDDIKEAVKRVVKF
jgi:transketolase